jgi:hypothetical protein
MGKRVQGVLLLFAAMPLSCVIDSSARAKPRPRLLAAEAVVQANRLSMEFRFRALARE